MAASSSLNLHSGGKLVSLEELTIIPTPEPSRRYYPVPHAKVYSRVKETLLQAGYEIHKQQLGVDKNDARFFGVFDLKTPVSNGVCLAVGIRSSYDRKFCLSFCAGSRVQVCSNLAFRSELLVKRRHTINGERRFEEAISLAVSNLGSFREEENRRVTVLQSTPINDVVAESLTVRAFERGIFGIRQFQEVLAEWRKPSFEEFQEPNLWRFFNAVTTCLGRAQRQVKMPAQFVSSTMALHQLLATAI